MEVRISRVGHLFLTIALFCGALCPTMGQEATAISETFYGTRVVNGHSVEMEEVGRMKFIIMHRFGILNDRPLHNLFGLDDSNIRFGFDYGISKRLTIGIGRSSFDKTYDGYLKCSLISQTTDFSKPFSLVYLAGMAIRTETLFDPNKVYDLSARTSYTHQLLLATKATEGVSVQLMPTFVHRNMVATSAEKNNLFALGIAWRLQLSKVIALNLEYYSVLPNQLPEGGFNPFSVGIDIKTGGHLFQLHLSNSRGMTERAFIAETTGDLLKGGMHLGFNITRNFQMKGRKY